MAFKLKLHVRIAAVLSIKWVYKAYQISEPIIKLKHKFNSLFLGDLSVAPQMIRLVLWTFLGTVSIHATTRAHINSTII